MRTLHLDTSTIGSMQDLKNSLRDIMKYGDWFETERGIDGWLDMVAFFDAPSDKNKRKTRRDGFEQFMLEITNADTFAQNHPDLCSWLLHWISNVNKRYAKRTGRSIIALAM